MCAGVWFELVYPSINLSVIEIVHDTMVTRFNPGWWLIALTLAVTPFAFRVELERGSTTLLDIQAPLVDPVLWCCGAAILLFRCWPGVRARPEKSRHGSSSRTFRSLFSVELLAFVGVAALSTLGSNLTAGSAKELLQLFDYYVLWYVVVAVTVRDDRLHQGTRLYIPIVALLAGIVLVAQMQIHTARPVYLIQSVFRDKQSYLSAFVVLAPVAWCGMVQRSRRIWQLVAHALVAIGCASLGSLGTVLLVGGQFCFASWLMGGHWLVRTITLVVATTFVFQWLTPASYRATVIQQPRQWLSVPLAQRRLEVLQVKRIVQPPQPELHFGWGAWRCFVGSNASSLLRSYSSPTSKQAAETTADQVIMEYYAESWAALWAVQNGPLLGRGPGNWLQSIGEAFGVLERTGTAFPNTINGYLMLGVNLGMLGLFVWYLAMRKAHIRALRLIRTSPPGENRSLAIGCWSGLLGATMFMLVHPLVTQPVVVYWVFLAAWTHALGNSQQPYHSHGTCSD